MTPKVFEPSSTHYLQHGKIFDVRWPSKKYKNTRRFCYVQFTSPVNNLHTLNDWTLIFLSQAAAASALSLHGYEAAPGRKLTVYISNPERKQERSDTSANAREIYVAGLSRSVSEKDLRNLFETVGLQNVFALWQRCEQFRSSDRLIAFVSHSMRKGTQKASLSSNLKTR